MNQLNLMYVKHSSTSLQAAEEMSPSRAKTDRDRVLKAIRDDYGLTDRECQIALCMSGDTQRPRRVELVRMGLVRDSGRTRKTGTGREATVWEVA